MSSSYSAEGLRAENPALQVTLSHRIGRFGILERENATLLNAMLRPLAERTVAGFRAAVPAHLFISQNDGTAMRAESAAQLPIFTVASGPTNSLRGAAILAALDDRGRVIAKEGTTLETLLPRAFRLFLPDGPNEKLLDARRASEGISPRPPGRRPPNQARLQRAAR